MEPLARTLSKTGTVEVSTSNNIGETDWSVAEEAEGDEIFLVNIEAFEGPLHLLLELARKQKVNLLKISVLALAEQYLEFIAKAKAERIDLSADYLLMASWLALIKSRLLLVRPKNDKLGDDEDPNIEAAKLAFRLKRLDAMRKASKELLNGAILNKEVFPRGTPEQSKIIKNVEFGTTMWELIQAFGTVRKRHSTQAPHVIKRQVVLPLEHARDSLKSIAKELKDWEHFETVKNRIPVIDDEIPNSSVTASTFCAALDLARLGQINMRQQEIFSDLFLCGHQSEDFSQQVN